MNAVSIESPIVDRRGETTTFYRLMSRIIASRLRKRYNDGPDRDDACQTAMAHAWTYFETLATTKPELTIEERAVLAAKRGSWECRRPVTIEPRPFRYKDALDYVSADDGLFHLPSHAGRQRYWLMTASEAVELPPAERDSMISQLPAQLRPYATLAAQGVTQAKIAERRGECERTVRNRLRDVKAAIADMIAEREIELARLSDGWRECCGLEPIETEATIEAIRECNDHASLVVETDRPTPVDTAVSSSWDMFNSVVFSSPEPLRKTYNVPLPIMPSCLCIVRNFGHVKPAQPKPQPKPHSEPQPATYWQSPYLDYVRSQSAVKTATSWTMWK